MERRPVGWEEIDDIDLSCPFCKDKDEKGCEYCTKGQLNVYFKTVWTVHINPEEYEEKKKEIMKRCNCFLTYNHVEGRYYISAMKRGVDLTPDLSLAFYICQGNIPSDLANAVTVGYHGGLSKEDYKIVLDESIRALEKVERNLHEKIEKLRKGTPKF